MSNLQKFFLYSGNKDFQERSGRAQWREDEQALMLEQNQQPRLSQPLWEEGREAWENAKPLVVDDFSASGELFDSARALGFKNHWQDTMSEVQDEYSRAIRIPEGEFTDLHCGGDSRLALGISDTENAHYQLGVFHLRKRWYETIALAEAPIRIWTDKQNQTWVISLNSLFVCSGQPLPHNYTPKKDHFEPVMINPQSLQVIETLALPEEITQPLALCEDGKTLYVLAEVEEDEIKQQKIFIHSLQINQQPNGAHWRALTLPSSITYATDIHPLSENRIALIIPKAALDSEYKNRDCPILELTQDGKTATEKLNLLAQRYPMRSLDRPRFASAEDRKLRYISEDGPEELFPLAQARFIKSATFNLSKVLDSGTPDTHWHKIILEACIPRGCSVSVMAYCTDETRNNDVAEMQAGEEKDFLVQHKPLWVPLNSELPFYSGWRSPKQDESGLFEILLQRPEGEVRELRGRFLQLRFNLSGDGRSSPAIHAIRVYYPRLCWQENFLPQHFQQQKMVDKNDTAAANGADVRQRLFASLECMLTPIEDRIAASQSLFDPLVAPSHLLPNIAKSLGIKHYPEHWPEPRVRRLISQTGVLQQRHGTYAGLVLALDIATDGALGKGKIVPLENFRFRRTLATILGVSLDDKYHPLTLGSAENANSIVGDSLILTKKGAREFLALLSPQSYSENESEQTDKQLIDGFFEQYAHQITVLLHGDAIQWKSNVEEVLNQHAPAHLQWRIKPTDHPFVLGLAPLLQIDTYLEQQPAETKVVLNQTLLGREGQIRNESVLSPASRPHLSGTSL